MVGDKGHRVYSQKAPHSFIPVPVVFSPALYMFSENPHLFPKHT